MTQLPPEAGGFNSGPFEPDDDWLASAPEELQIAAMRRWFLDRYEDPANETPWDGEDKEYVFVWGGPYDPDDEIQSRFSGIVEFDTMRELIEELWCEVGDKWAPIKHEGVDYDEYVSHLFVIDRSDPNRFLEERIAEIFAVLEAAVLAGANNRLLHQMAHSSLIAALEAYLADTVSYWVEKDKRALRRFVSTNKEFQARLLTIAEIFERIENLTGEVKTYLADFIWHRLDKVKPMLASGLEIQVPEIGDLMKEIIVRHDIVHRAGRKADGTLVELSPKDLSRVRDAIQQFSKGIEEELVRRFPVHLGSVSQDLF
ncbi:hypothetical protein [Acidithiobacillus ferridurans]|jgi:hypothetical protein|uniref:hypothetical protein n=1 Tax=Acidithiobacillus ferridurans TaxID=1232575 RepID=UPI001C07AD30|nr:hypothetical protein [Acidithiobacillus ferridurans]MBU2731408.1 hypothetical protein [Acidithiobacillus ferridurans]